MYVQFQSTTGQGWRRNSNVPQEGYGTSSVIADQGIFLAASVYRPVFEVTCLVVVCFICASHYHYYVVHEVFFFAVYE